MIFSQTTHRSAALARIASGICLTLPLFSAGLAVAQGTRMQSPSSQSPSINPCPQVYYEEPYNSTRIVPQGCPPNAATQNQQGSQSTGQTSSTGSQRPIANSTAASRDLNPCPKIYYEEPFNSTRAVPQGCPPNAATQNQSGQSGFTPR
jgi:hypothetical protein